jgi:hypothetical protein
MKQLKKEHRFKQLAFMNKKHLMKFQNRLIPEDMVPTRHQMNFFSFMNKNFHE